MHLLIVEDDASVSRFLKQAVEEAGHETTVIADGAVALETALAQKFDLMLLDLNMPVMNGLECVKALRKARLHPDMKVMMVTTEADNHFIAKALDNGADEFLMKPFTQESLREKMMLLGFAA